MEKKPVNSATRSLATQLLFLISSILCTCALATSQELLTGFKASPSSSVSSFQSLLNDSTSTFSLGFLRANQTQLALTVVHLPSLQPLWHANPTSSFRWSDKTQLFFNGSLVMSDPHTRSFWSSGTSKQGDRVVLLNSSNLQILQQQQVLWQSFDFPTSTLVENQSFTSNMSLVSSNGLYSMRLGVDFMALYANFKDGKTQQMYWKHKALEAKAEVVQGQGPIHARLESDGFLGMYQIGKTPVDIQPFNSFHRPIDTFLVLRLEPDGNLKGYYWAQTDWVLDYQAITETCELPSPCGSYGLCRPGSGCSCLDNRTQVDTGSFQCIDGDDQSGDFCSGSDDFWAIRRIGVELPFKELMGSDTKSSSVEECELSCHGNCSCWGAVYNNVTGFCYLVDYPIQTLVGVGDESKIGYFKVRATRGGHKKMKAGMRVLGAVILTLTGAVLGYAGYKIWNRRRTWPKRVLEENAEVSPGPYKNLGSASFKSIQMI
uniref:Apple domain-containing protein n=1 Tax=Salix viminalis TaxID=40686 RepID=A0A6N2LPU1_SALVM